MKKILFCAALASFSKLACADDFYAGLGVSGSRSGHVLHGSGGQSVRTEGESGHLPLKLFGAYAFTPNLGLEAGYLDGGSLSFDLRVAPGDQLRGRMHGGYLAARGALALDDHWSLFGKLGVARSDLEMRLSSAGQSASTHQRGLYASVGGAYALSPNLSLQLELEHLPRARVEGFSWSTNQFALGVRYGF